ncbi:hypothetical protein GEMRC1_005179 [Eukaryota sp. GEM-RC1]
MQSRSHKVDSSSVLCRSAKSTDFVTFFSNEHRSAPFADDIYHSMTAFGSPFGHLFVLLFELFVGTLMLFLSSLITLISLYLHYYSNVHETETFHIMQVSRLPSVYDCYEYVLNCAFCLFFMSSLPVCVSRIFAFLENEKSIDKTNDLNCLKSFNAIFCYRWNYTGKFDVEYFLNKLSEQLKEEHSLTSQKDNVHFPKLKWVYIFLMPLLLVVIMTIFVVFSTHQPLVSRDFRLRYLELGLLVCLFNYFGRKMLYYFTSPAPAPEKDSTRLWYLIFLKLCFFLSPFFLFLEEFDETICSPLSCFGTQLGTYISTLFLLTFFFDVIFPFFWYKCRSLSKSFEKPLFDLPGSQAKVFTTMF